MLLKCSFAFWLHTCAVRVTSQRYTQSARRSCALIIFMFVLHGAFWRRSEALWLPYPAFCPLKLETVSKVKESSVGSPKRRWKILAHLIYTWSDFVYYMNQTWIAPSLSIQQFLLGRGCRHSLIILARKNDHITILQKSDDAGAHWARRATAWSWQQAPCI